MGQNCSFGDAAVSREAFSASFDLCLQYLSRYQQMSSIAKKSSYLLQESAKRLSTVQGYNEVFDLYLDMFHSLAKRRSKNGVLLGSKTFSTRPKVILVL
jgi:hypothetical protein